VAAESPESAGGTYTLTMRTPALSRLNSIIPLPDDWLGGIIGGGVAGAVAAVLSLALGSPVSTAAAYVMIGLLGGVVIGARRPRMHSWMRAGLVGGAVGASGDAVARAGTEQRPGPGRSGGKRVAVRWRWSVPGSNR
jgi:hypothetical protein